MSKYVSCRVSEYVKYRASIYFWCRVSENVIDRVPQVIGPVIGRQRIFDVGGQNLSNIGRQYTFHVGCQNMSNIGCRIYFM